MKKTIYSIAILALLSLNLNAATFMAETDFTGTWKLDTAKSTGLPSGMEQMMTVTQTSKTIKIATKLITEQGEENQSNTYTLDGKETEFSTYLSESTTSSSDEGEATSTVKKTGNGKVAAKRTADGIEIKKTLVYPSQNGDTTIQITSKWTLSSDGKTLSIVTNVKNSSSTLNSKQIFNKK